MNKAKKLSIIFIAVLCLSITYAQDYDLSSGKFYELKEGESTRFEHYNGTYNICENEAKAIPILIVNEADIDDKYFLEAFGASWIRLNVNEFSLPKKQSGAVLLELSPGKGTSGNYKARVTSLSSIGNVQKELGLNINAEKCYSFSLELEKEEDKACGGEKKQYIGEVINDGTNKADVELSLRGPNWIGIDKNSFSILSDKKENFELIADVPANARGIFNVFVDAMAQNLPSIKQEKKLGIEVVPKYDCYKAGIIADEKIKNYYANEYVPIKIRNSGIKQAEYELSIEGPIWISIEPKRLVVKPEQLGNFNLNINPDANVTEGAYAVKLNAKLDDIVYSKNIIVVLRKSQFLKNLKFYFVFFQYYLYIVLVVAVVLFVFRGKVYNKIKTSYRNYKLRKARLRALEKARKAKKRK